MKIIPAIDLIEGRCVRLSKGDYETKKIYSEDPVEVAKSFEDHGIKYLHLIDLDGAKSHRVINHDVLERIAHSTNLSIDFGGGLKSDQDIQLTFDCGASQVTIGSIAVQNKALFVNWLEQYGSEKIILGADCRDRRIATNGWLESSEIDVIEFIQSYEKIGVREVISTDISKDGMLEGASMALYQEILNQTQVKLIASGGVSSKEDLLELKQIGCHGAIVGKAIYEGRISLKELGELC